MKGTTTKPAVIPAETEEPSVQAAMAPEEGTEEATEVTTEPGSAGLTLNPQDFAIPAMPFDCTAGGGQFLPDRPTGEEVPLSSGMGGTYEMVDGKRVRV